MVQPLTRVFVSFDFDNDKILKDFVIGQAKNPSSPFNAADWSMKEAAPQRNWESEARSRINRADIVLVMVGTHTHRALGVLKEIRFAHEARKPVYQIIGYKGADPKPVPGAGPLRRWTEENLKKILDPQQFGRRSPTGGPFRDRGFRPRM